jgi:hypothetical protein
MNAYRTNATIAGVLYIIGTVAGILSLALTQPLRGAQHLLPVAAANANLVIVAALCVLLMCLSLALVPVALYPVLKRHSQVLALGYVVFRGALETIIGMITPIAWLLLVALSRTYVAGQSAATPGLQATAALLLKPGAADSLAGIVFCLGALMFYTVLYRSRLVPRWITVWGLAALVLDLAAQFLALFAVLDPVSSAATPLFMPIAVQEMVLAVWLIVKGFSAPAVAAEATTVAPNELLSAA